MSIQEEVTISNETPVLVVDFDYDNWYFLTPEGGEQIGPYKSWQRAIEKYREYRAYVTDAPICHHL